MTASLQEQIKEVKREIRKRESAYPRWILNGTITREDADYQMATMKDVLHTLEQKDAIDRPELFPHDDPSRKNHDPA